MPVCVHRLCVCASVDKLFFKKMILFLDLSRRHINITSSAVGDKYYCSKRRWKEIAPNKHVHPPIRAGIPISQ